MTVGRIFTRTHARTHAHTHTYLYVFIMGFFENRKNSGLTPGQNDDPVTRT